MSYTSIGQKIKELMDKKNVTVIQMANKLGRTRQNMYAIFQGDQKVSTDLLEEISTILEVTPIYFWTKHNNDLGKYSHSLVEEEKQNLETISNEIQVLKKQLDLTEKLLAEKEEKCEMYKELINELRSKLSS